MSKQEVVAARASRSAPNRPSAGQGTLALPLRGLSPLINPAQPGLSTRSLIQKLFDKPRAKGGSKSFRSLSPSGQPQAGFCEKPSAESATRRSTDRAGIGWKKRRFSMAKTKTAECGCVVEAEGDMDMVQYCDQHRPANTVGMYVCICGAAYKTFEQLQDHAYNTDCLFPEVEGRVAA